MKLENIEVTRLKKYCGVVIPSHLVDTPLEALKYAAGFLWPNLPTPDLREIVKKYGDPHCHNAVHDPEAKNYVSGHVVAGGLKGGYRVPRGGEVRHVTEHEADLVEIHQRMERNPTFIPREAWDQDSSGAFGSDFARVD